MSVNPATTVPLTSRQKQLLHGLRTDLEFYAGSMLKTKTKDGSGVVNMKFDRVQRFITRVCDRQRAEFGWVRKIFVKGRQQRTSSTIAARFFRDAQMLPGTDVFILSHEGKSTDALFQKAVLFNSELSHQFPQLAQGTVKENRQEMEFTNRSTYGVGTAGQGNTGRGKTITRFHGSECAFWDNADEIKTGVLQAIALMRNTEVILESTCNGMNWWYELVMASLRGEGDYEVEFIPWFWTDEYRRPLRGEFRRTRDENDLCQMVANDKHRPWILDDEQLSWRRSKIVELGSLSKFRQEYPSTLTEAFQTSGDAYYDPLLVAKALSCLDNEGNEMQPDTFAARVVGCDVGRRTDRTTVFTKVGHGITVNKIWDEAPNAVTLAGYLKGLVDRGEADMIFIDYALGAAVVDIMVRDGYGDYIQAVDFGSSPIDDKYANKRAEMMGLTNDWLNSGNVFIKAQDDKQAQLIAADFAMIPEPEPDLNGRILFISKKELRKKFKRSPDMLDGIALCHAFPVKGGEGWKKREIGRTVNTSKGSALQSRNRVARTRETVEVGESSMYDSSGLSRVTPRQSLRRRFN